MNLRITRGDFGYHRINVRVDATLKRIVHLFKVLNDPGLSNETQQLTCLGDCVVVDRVEVVEKSWYAFDAIAYGHVEVAHENREERVHVGF